MATFTAKKPKTVFKYATFVGLLYESLVVTRNLCERAREEMSRVDTGLSVIPSLNAPHIFLIWEGNSVTSYQFRAIETILHTNPNAEVLIFSNELDLDTFKIYSSPKRQQEERSKEQADSEDNDQSTSTTPTTTTINTHRHSSNNDLRHGRGKTMTNRKNRNLKSLTHRKSTNSFLKQMVKEKRL